MSKFEGLLSMKNRQTAISGRQTPAEAVSELKNGKSKPLGKRRDPDYTQITAYVRKDTHENVMRSIYKRQEFSELIEELLIDWLKKSK